MEFKKFKVAIAEQFAMMQKYPMFRTAVEKDALWEMYLNSYPVGTNDIFRTRREHDCTCCKQFIRAVGNVVAAIDGKLVSLWGVTIDDEPAFQVVTDALNALVLSAPIANVFMHEGRTAGTDKNFEEYSEGTLTWEHFFVNIPHDLVKRKDDIGTHLSKMRSTYDVCARGLREITEDSIELVIELIKQNSLYRGEEFLNLVEEFGKYKKEYLAIPDESKDIFVWTKVILGANAVTNFRNTVIGTLLVDISEGVELGATVAMFESKVAPANYKRSSAPITKGMLDKAKGTIEELGLTSALGRRHANFQDITANNILFKDRSANKAPTGDIFDELAGQLPQQQKTLDRVEEIPIEKFISDVLPTATSVEVMMENSHQPNLMSLMAPMDPTAGHLFKWDNNFSWSYKGEVADSIKERVKRHGGNVVGDFRCSLSWFNYDDLDIHMAEQPSNYQIGFPNKGMLSPNGGMLDVDMNMGHGTTREPVENIVYGNMATMNDGIYVLFVNNYQQRELTNPGFEIEIEIQGKTVQLGYDKVVKQGEIIQVAVFKYTRATGIGIVQSIPRTIKSKILWGVSTNVFEKVNTILLSPNHWDGQGVGNKHYFFIMQKCVNDEPARGFYNEFLNNAFTPHRKVFEVLGGKMRVEPSNAPQMSGLGFSSTQRNSLLCRISGKFTRIVRVVF